VAEFRSKGYLPEALVNYLALIGWSPGGGDELLPIDELARRFSLDGVGHSAGVFDEREAGLGESPLPQGGGLFAPSRSSRCRTSTTPAFACSGRSRSRISQRGDGAEWARARRSIG